MKVSTKLKQLVPTDVVANLKWRARVHKLVMDDPSVAELFKEACAADPIFFINGFLWTHDPREEPFAKLPFILYPFQEELVGSVLEAANNYDLLIEKSRTMGVSWILMAIFVWIWLYKEDRPLLIGSRNENLVDKPGDPDALLWRVDFLIDNLPSWLKPCGYVKSQHRLRKHIENPEKRNTIDGESTTANFATGGRRYAIVLDEFSKVPNGDEMLASTQAVSHSRIINGTPYGIANAFYELTLHSRIKKIRLHWTLHPTYSRGLYKKESEDNGKYIPIDIDYWRNIPNPEQQMIEYDTMIIERGVPLPPDKERSPWYAKECARAKSAIHIAQELDINYIGSGGPFFDAAKVLETITKYARPPLLIGDLEYDHQTGDPIRFRQSKDGRLRLWIQLNKEGKPSIDPNHRVSLGCDISAGTGASNSSGAAWNERTCEKIAEYVNPFDRPEGFAVKMVALSKWLNNAEISWESNGPGRQFGAKIKDLNYGNIYLRTNDQSISVKVSDIPGYPSTRESKLLLLGNYRDKVESGECCNTSKEALEECLEYVFTPDGSVDHARASDKTDPSGAKANHGDRVIADALALKGIAYKKLSLKKQPPEIPIGSLAWRKQRLKNLKQKSPLELSSEWRK